MKIKYYIYALLAAVLLIGFCACGIAKSNVVETTGSSVSAAPGGSDVVGDTEEVLLTETQSESASGYSLGSALMTSTEGKSASVFYSPLGGAVSVELEDAAGNKWRLEVPENALPYGETITMQLCESVKTDVVSGKQIAGVVFQPEGLQFTLPATLTVTGPLVTEETCVFFGEGSGEDLSFAAYETVEKNVRASVSHFSAYIVYAPTGSSEIREAQGLAAEAYGAVLKEVKALLKTPITAPPIPEDYTFECVEKDGGNASKDRNRALDAYIRSVLDPEYALGGRLVGAGRQIAHLGGETDSLYYAGLLLSRDLKKADKLIRTYRNDNEKLIPVMNLTFKIIKEMGALGMDIPPGYMETFSEWMARAADEQLRKIREEHDYKALSPALALAEGSAILASDFSASANFTRDYLEKLKKAMAFQVKFTVSVYTGIAEQNMTLEGEADINFLDKKNENAYTGTGTGKYLTYTHNGIWTTRIDYPNEYAVHIKFIDFSPCDSEKVKVWVNTIGSDNEVWYNPGIDERNSGEYSFVNFIAEEIFGDYAAETGGYIFEVPFQNKNAVMGSESFTKTGTISYPDEGAAAGSITYTIEIKHTPK